MPLAMLLFVAAASGQDLTVLLERCARTGDAALVQQAKVALEKATPAEREKYRARMLQLEGRAEEAMAAARAYNKRMPDDLDGYAVLADLHREAKRLEEAEKATQWMLNLRALDPRGLYRAALLREDFGDLEGAMDMMSECYQRTSEADSGRRADALMALARMFEKKKDHASAVEMVGKVLEMEPAYKAALEMKEQWK